MGKHALSFVVVTVLIFVLIFATFEILKTLFSLYFNRNIKNREEKKDLLYAQIATASVALVVTFVVIKLYKK